MKPRYKSKETEGPTPRPHWWQRLFYTPWGLEAKLFADSEAKKRADIGANYISRANARVETRRAEELHRLGTEHRKFLGQVNEFTQYTNDIMTIGVEAGATLWSDDEYNGHYPVFTIRHLDTATMTSRVSWSKSPWKRVTFTHVFIPNTPRES